jgi:tetratricopeptide (TPR) repeat protein
LKKRYYSALEHVNFLLQLNSTNSQYYNTKAHVYFCLEDFHEMNKMVDKGLKYARNPIDMAQSLFLKSNAIGVTGFEHEKDAFSFLCQSL